MEMFIQTNRTPRICDVTDDEAAADESLFPCGDRL
jgi:hypothetical protein